MNLNDIPIAFRRKLDALCREASERRRLFFAVMRRPEMRVLRAALLWLKHESGVEWKTLTSLSIEQRFDAYSPWMLTTEGHLVICYDEHDPTDFSVLALQ